MDDADQTRPTGAPPRPAVTIDSAEGPADPRTEAPTGGTPRPRTRGGGGNGTAKGATKNSAKRSGTGAAASGNGATNGSKRRAVAGGSSAGSGTAPAGGNGATAAEARTAAGSKARPPATTPPPSAPGPATTPPASSATPPASSATPPASSADTRLPGPSPAATATASEQPSRPGRVGGMPTASPTRPKAAATPVVIDVPDAPDDPSGPVEIPPIVPADAAPAEEGTTDVAESPPSHRWRLRRDHHTDAPTDAPATATPTTTTPTTATPAVPTVPIGDLPEGEFSDTDGTAGLPALHRPVRPARSLRQPVVVRRSRRPRVRKVTRVVRHVDTWSVFKVAVVFHAFLYMVCLMAGVLLWQVAQTTGTVDNIERFFESFGWQSFQLKGGEIYHNAWIAGLFLAIGGTGLTVLAATLFNLITDLVGGIRLTVLEEEVIAREERGLGWRRAFRRHGPTPADRHLPADAATPAPADEGVTVVAPEQPVPPTDDSQPG